MIHDVIPYSLEKNLGKAYNDSISLIPDGDYVCIRDGDTCWLTPDYMVHLAEYTRLYPDAVLTCWTNRIHERAEQHLLGVHNETDMIKISLLAKDRLQDLYQVTPLHGFVSGFCLLFPKSLWQLHKFSEVQVYPDRGPTNMLGVDNDWTNRIRAAGIQVLRMDGIMIYHSYRLLTNSKSHLL